jgi:hypothetical protein
MWKNSSSGHAPPGKRKGYEVGEVMVRDTVYSSTNAEVLCTITVTLSP